MSNNNGRKHFNQGNILPKMAAKRLLFRNARDVSELQSHCKQLDKEKKELENDFSKAKCRLLSFHANRPLQSEQDVGLCDVLVMSDSDEDLVTASDGFSTNCTYDLQTAAVYREPSMEAEVPYEAQSASEIGHTDTKASKPNHTQEHNMVQLSCDPLCCREPGRKINWIGNLDFSDTNSEVGSLKSPAARKISCEMKRLDEKEAKNSIVCLFNSPPRRNTCSSWDELDDFNLKKEVLITKSLEKNSGALGRKISWAGRTNSYEVKRDLITTTKEEETGRKARPGQGKQGKEDTTTNFPSHSPPEHKICWTGKLTNNDTQKEPLRQQIRRKISRSWGGSDWDTRSEISQARSEMHACRKRQGEAVRRSQSFNGPNVSNAECGCSKVSVHSQNQSSSSLMRRMRTQSLYSQGDLDSTTGQNDKKCTVIKPLSDILPPITLPRVYLQGMKNKKVNKKAKHRTANCSTQDKVTVRDGSSVDDLVYCRYLRVKENAGEDLFD